MAPRPPVHPPSILAALRRPGVEQILPMFLGGPTVRGGILVENGVWRLRRAVADGAAFDAFVKAEAARGRLPLPESGDRFMVLRGEILVEAADLPAFIAALERFSWPAGW